MKEHSETLLKSLALRLKTTLDKAPLRTRGYELERCERRDPKVRERLLEKRIWQRSGFEASHRHRQPFFGEVCSFIQTYQMPLVKAREDKKWGKIDLVGATSDALPLPVVIELKIEDSKDTPLRALVEALAYACGVRKAWDEGRLRAEWAAAMTKHGLPDEPERKLTKIPVILLAEPGFWKRAVGTQGRVTEGKVQEDAWPVFMELVRQCGLHGFPIYFAQIHKGVTEEDCSGPLNVTAVRLLS
jgi:hypothetical protein